MPKITGRVWPHLLRAFRITGDAGRRLRFRLGDNILPCIDADCYEGVPTFAFSAQIGPAVGEYAAIEIKPDLHGLRVVYWQVANSTIWTYEGPSDFELSPSDVIPAGWSSHGWPLSGEVRAGRITSAPSGAIMVDIAGNSQRQAGLPVPIFIPPGKVFRLRCYTDNTSSTVSTLLEQRSWA